MSSLKEKIKNFIPGMLFNPIYLCEKSLSTLIIKSIDESSIQNNEKWLDVGCGTRPYEIHFPKGTYFGVDVDHSGRDIKLKSPDFFYDGTILPFQNSIYDGVICTQVLEHVTDPKQIISEISRVLKPGGVLIVSIPFAWQEHEEPFDFFRYSSYGMGMMLREKGFNVTQCSKDLGAIESIAVLLNVYISNNLSSKWVSYFVNFLICFPIQLIAKTIQLFCPDQKKFYLNLVIKAQKT